MRFLIFVLLIPLLVMTACESEPPQFTVDDLPAGDAAQGEVLFAESINSAPTCASCHTLTETKGIGPGLAGYGERATSQVEGESAEEYTYYSIIRPAKHLVTGFSNVMYTEYEQKLSTQDIADLIAYLLTL